jgi:hypothetical protein
MSTLVFNANTPTGGQTIASTTIPINTNFASLNSAFNAPVGGVTGGGTFCSYSFQATTTSFTAKPINPIGVLSTVASTSGNPELSWINNVNSTGAGPYNGVQLTGGGITAAAWVFFTIGGGGAPSIAASYNVASVTNTGANTNKTITFTRGFSTANYVSMINGYQTGTGDTTNRKTNIVSQLSGSITFNVTITSTLAQSELTLYHCVFFGYLT